MACAEGFDAPSSIQQQDVYGFRKNLPQLAVAGVLTIIIGFTLQLHTVSALHDNTTSGITGAEV
eukprot:7703918-Pyramimonas_sp.AAC.2